MTRRLLVLATALAALLLLPGPAARAEAAPEGGGAITGVVQVENGDTHACARLTTGRAMCWGTGDANRLGFNGISDSDRAGFVQGVGDVGRLTQVAQLSLGADHSCARLTTGQARCWGENQNRQLGTGDQQDGGPFVVENRTGGPMTGITAIAAGANHTCAIVAGGQVRCFGSNVNGQLGDGSIQPRTRAVTVLDVNGSTPLTGATQISAGSNYTCVRLNTGQARCWGNNTAGQLGRGNNDSRNRPVVVKNGTGTGPLTGVTQLSTGSATTCARMSDNTARCWGGDVDGILGNAGAENASVLPVRVRAVSGAGFLTGVKNISVGSFHACATVTGNQLRCWGDGNDSQLGTGNVSDRTRPAVVRNVADTGALLGATQVSSGENFTCARLNNGQARCWGEDTDGQLGNGAGGTSDTPVVVLTL
jgi:alpha-tubulin suppressor-like RCC1 family protein